MFLKLLDRLPFNLRYLLLFVVLECCLMGLMTLAWQNNRSNYLNSRAKQLEIASSALLNNYEAVAHSVFHQVIDKDPVRALLSATLMERGARRDAVRKRLYQHLLPDYQRLQQESPLKIQLILPDGTSLLRMHQPDKWGDQLFQHRELLRQAVRDQQEVQGYDSGRFAMGAYRFAFPLFDGKRFLGVVELSLFAETQVSLLQQQHPGSAWFMLVPQSQAEARLMQPYSEGGQLRKSSIAPEYLEIWGGEGKGTGKLPELLARLQGRTDVREILQSKASGSVLAGSVRDIPQAVVFFPLVNFQGGHEGYLVGIGPAPLVRQLNRSMQIISVLGTVLVIGVTLLARFLALRRRELLHERDMLRAITDGMGEGLLVQDLDGSLQMINPAAEQLLGYRADQFADSAVHDLIHSHCADSRGLCPIQHTTGRNERYDQNDEQFRRSDGSMLPVAVVATPLLVHGKNSGSVMLFSDMTQKLAQQAQILRLNSLYAALSRTNHAIVHCKTRQELFDEICHIAVEYADFSAAYIGLPEGDLQLRIVAVSGQAQVAVDQVLGIRHDPEQGCEISRTFFAGKSHICLKRCDFNTLFTGGACTAMESPGCLGLYPLRCDGKIAATLVLYAERPDTFDERQTVLLEEMAGDVSFALDTLLQAEQFQHTQHELQQLTNFDPLTGLPNRTLLLDRIEQAMRTMDKNDSTLGLLLVGLDRFKTINNSFGHAVGDRVLREVARRMQGFLPEGATLARPGNDEFLLLVPDATVSGCAHLAGQLLRAVSELPVQVVEQQVTVTARVGISIWPNDAVDSAGLLKHVYSALSRAKQGDENSYQFFTADMTSRSVERLTLENELRRALEEGQFVLFYQPKVEAASGAVAGCEALVRWQHPVRGLMPPDLFIPVMEEIGLIGRLGNWVLYEACSQAVRWRQQGMCDLVMAVNISPMQFTNQWLADEVFDVVRGSGLSPEVLELEITESTAMQDVGRTMEIMAGLRKHGIKIAIDDFGTGYSSLAHLKRLSANTLKVDRSFVKNLPNDKEDVAICEAILAMASNLGMEVVAEGVETAEQYAFMVSRNCRYIQGYFFSRPLTAAAFATFFTSRSRLIQ